MAMMTMIMVMIILTVLLKTMMSVINIEIEGVFFFVSNDIESSLETGMQNCSDNGYGENDKDKEGFIFFMICGLG